jgi:hypothetical protein
MFHNILLLGPGGKTIYQGNVSDAAQYFSSLGFNTPANVNPADFYMDVIGGSVDIGDEEIDLFEAWKKRPGTHDERRESTSGGEQGVYVLSNSDPEGGITACMILSRLILCLRHTIVYFIAKVQLLLELRDDLKY